MYRPWKHMGHWRCSSTHFNPGTTWRWAVSFTAGPLCLRGKCAPFHSVGGWVRARASLDVSEKRKLSCLCRESSHEPSYVQPMEQSLWWLHSPSPLHGFISAYNFNPLFSLLFLFCFHLSYASFLVENSLEDLISTFSPMLTSYLVAKE
jgi:hypothetical protein